MRYIVEVTPGDYTSEHSLDITRESIRIVLSDAVRDVADNVFPEYVFGDVIDETA